MTNTIQINNVSIDDTFAEAFDMKATRVVITAEDQQWADDAAAAMTGFGTSVIACGIEIAVERVLDKAETPDGRPGVAVAAFAVSGKELEKQIPRRAGQCILTCPTTALYAGVDESNGQFDKRIALGKSLRYFGDGHQISKQIGDRRFWRIPVMDGEFVCDHDVARVDGVGGGNFILIGCSIDAVTVACRAAIEAIKPLPGVITPFPGGATRSGSKVGSKYAALFASTNEAYCPTLRTTSVSSQLSAHESFAIELVIDGMTAEEIARSMRIGIDAACHADHHGELLRITAGNYGGKLGRHHFHLAEVLA